MVTVNKSRNLQVEQRDSYHKGNNQTKEIGGFLLKFVIGICIFSTCSNISMSHLQSLNSTEEKHARVEQYIMCCSKHVFT